MSAYLCLILAIVAEVIATLSLKSIDGFNRPLPLLITVVGYSCAFWLLSLVMRTLPIGIAYAIWCGLGIVLVSLMAVFVHQQRLDLPAMVGMAMIVGGVAVIQLFSSASAH